MDNDAISRSAVLDALETEKRRLMEQNEGSWPFTRKILTRAVDVVYEFVKALPALDVAPVVRCRDCKHRCTMVCPMYHTETSLDDLDGFDDYNVDRTDNDGFCHLGERMDGDAE